MANNVFILGTLTALGWVFVNGSPQLMETTARPAASQIAAADTSMTSSATAARSPILEAHRDPVPLVRNVRVFPTSPVSTDTLVVGTEQQAQEDLDRRGAKAAIELDGYKRVDIIGKASNGAWRAKGYRGTAEVLLTVDGTGRVSMD